MISNERLEELAGDFILNGFATVGECTEIARELLALRKAFSEPMAFTDYSGLRLAKMGMDFVCWPVANESRVIALYRKPPTE